MRRQSWWLPMVALVFLTNWKSTLTLPVPDEELDTSTKLLGSSVVTSVSVVTGASDAASEDNISKISTADRKRVISSTDLPGSPANLMRPDKFQFFTLNKDGHVVTKQMTEEEIQSLIAAGGGHLPMEIHEPQQVGDVPSGGMKVADVVQNVQNVLKGELNKPATVMTSVPTIPGHVNTEWSSILPSILGGDSETAPVSESDSLLPSDNEIPVVVNTTPGVLADSAGIQKITTKLPAKETASVSAPVNYDSVKKPTETVETESPTEKPMIQVPVITVEQKLPTQQSEENSMPVFQMLNTISAEKVNKKNYTHVNDKTKPAEIPNQDISKTKPGTSQKPEKLPVEQTTTVKASAVEQTTVVNEKVPEMIEINYNSGTKEPSVITHVKKPIAKPQSETISSETASKLPGSETPATMTVVSETHSTSMKVSGQEEIPLRKPPAPIIEVADRIQASESLAGSEKPERATEKVPTTTTSDSKLAQTTLKAETITEKPVEQSLISQGISFLGNLPQTVNSIVSDLITGNSPNSTPTIEEADVHTPLKNSGNMGELAGTSETVKIPDSTKSPMAQNSAPTKVEAITSAKPATNKEPVYQMMPEIIPDKKTPSHGSFSPEVSSIEHIIETLNDPTGSISGTIAADHFVIQKKPESDSTIDSNQGHPLKTSRIPPVYTSTAATPITVENSLGSNSTKPIEPLPTELVDSLTSMISQVSDAVPSVLLLGQNAGLDATEKKNVVNVNAEKSGVAENATETEAPVKVELPIQAEPEASTVVPVKTTYVHQHSTTISDVKTSTEKLEKTPATELPSAVPITTQSSNSDDFTTVNSVGSLANNESVEIPVNRINQEIPQKLESPIAKPEVPKPEVDELQASSEMIDKVIPQAEVQEPTKIEIIPETVTTVRLPTEKTPYSPPVSNDTSSSSSTASVANDPTETTTKGQTDWTEIVEVPSKLEDEKTEGPVKIKLNKNDTELPIVHLDITEAKPTKFHKANESQGTNIADDGAESPLVRIKLTDPITLINSMIESSTADVRPPPSLVPLNLPETGSVPPNTIASGLIAGFPSTTNPTTTVVNLDTNSNETSNDSVQPPPEVLILNDAPASNVAEGINNTEVKKSETKVENITEPEKQVLEKGDVVIEKIKIPETSTPEAILSSTSEVPIIRIESLNEPANTDDLEKPVTANVVPAVQTSTENTRNDDIISQVTTTKSVDIEPSTTETTIAALSGNESITPNTAKNVTHVANQSAVSAAPINGLSEKPINVSTSPTAEILEFGGNFSIPSKPDVTTEQPERTNTKTDDPGVSVESNNVTNSLVSQNVPQVEDSDKLPTTIQSTAAPTTVTSAIVKEPLTDPKVQSSQTIQDAQTVTMMQNSNESLKNLTETSTDSFLQTTTAITIEKTAMTSNDEKTKVDNDDKISGTMQTIAESTLPEQIAEPSNVDSALQQSEEVRIRVNNTAVLVTKRPVSDITSQKPSSTTKSPEKLATDEQPTTPKIISITEESYAKLGEKNQQPALVQLLGSSSSYNDTPIRKGPANASGTDTRVRLDEEKIDKIKDEKVAAKIDNTRKPIKKNSDSSAIDEKTIPTTILPSTDTNEKTVVNKEQDLQPPLPTEGKVTSNVTSNESLNVTNVSDWIKVQQKPIDTSESSKSTVITEAPVAKPGKPVHKPTLSIKKDDAEPKPADDQWTLIPQQVHPVSMKTNSTYAKRPTTTEGPTTTTVQDDKNKTSTERPPVSLEHPKSASGLDTTVKNLETDVSYFVNLCNELAFSFWTATNKGLSSARSLAVSPFGMTSMLAMLFLGARGPTSDQMNDVLKLDEVASFNPHLVFQNVTDAVGLARNQGIANAAFVRELFADRSKVRKLMPFYKEQAQQFYDGIVAEVNFATISDLVRRRTNLMIRKQTGGRIKDFVRTNTVPLRSPLAALSANVFQTDCNSSAASSEGRDGELYFAVSPAVRQRKLVPIPATVWRAGVLAGYEPSLDATAIALGGTDKLVSTIFVIPGQQGLTAPGDTLDRLEQRIVKGAIHDGAWNKLLKVLIPRPGLELQVPKFSHRSVINATAALKRMGLEELFSKHADLKGINGVATDLHLADVLQMNLFSTCGDENIITGRHHVEVYPASPQRNAREYVETNEETEEPLVDYLNSGADDFRGSAIPYIQKRAARSARQNDATEKQRLKLDRPFLYFVRHNPKGLILHMGRFNPRLLP